MARGLCSRFGGMSLVLQSLCDHARGQPRAVALRGEYVTLTYGDLVAQVERFASELARRDVQVLGLLADNSPTWVATALAAIHAGVTLVPLPGFFSDAHLRPALADAGV